MGRSRFDSFNSFIARRRRLIIVAWIIALIIAGTQVPVFFGAVNYNIANANFGGPTNTESQEAQDVLNAQFPSNATGGSNGIVIVFQTSQVYSDQIKSAFLDLNRTVASDPILSKNFTGMDSIYSTEYSALKSTVPGLVSQVATLSSTMAGSNESASPTADWDAASQIVVSATVTSLASSPLFHANAASLYALVSSLENKTSPSQIEAAIQTVVVNGSVADYPLAPTPSLAENFVSPDNSTMIVIYNFSSQPDAQAISAFEQKVNGSALASLGNHWVTGDAVVQQDVSKVFGPAVGVTVVPGVIASIAIVGLLLLSPLAAIIPVMIGGFAIVISLPLIYLGVVSVGHGTLGFLTPTLTILLVLGLAVDYSVLQLRRTREERSKGRSKEESVGTSVRWAGQAVLTAGITVVVAYLVMSVAKVPLFSDVGSAIAIAVSVLILAALTLLPALELTLGDRLFWPRLGRRSIEKPSKIKRLAEKTLRLKAPVIVVMTLLALGAFYISLQTPAGADFFKLLPDFPSNHGLTVITDKFGSGITGPTQIVVTMPSPIALGADQFNQTLLDDIQNITSTAASVSGVVMVTSPTEPYATEFNYTGVSQLGEPAKAQYLSGMLSNIGKDNRTAVINLGLSADPESQTAITILKNVESRVDSLDLPKGTTVYFGGTTQSTLDSQSFIDGIIPQVILTLAIAIYIILFIQLRSAFTPIRLIFTILCSVAFSLGVLTLVFYYLLSTPIFDFAPLFVVVTMLGVGIDYDIFLVTRIREEVMNGSFDNDAIKTALSKSWVTIFGLGLVLATVFSSVVFTGIGMLQEIGFVVAAAVMIDVATVILFLVPSLMGLAEKFNWWPAKIGREADEES